MLKKVGDTQQIFNFVIYWFYSSKIHFGWFLFFWLINLFNQVFFLFHFITEEWKSEMKLCSQNVIKKINTWADIQKYH